MANRRRKILVVDDLFDWRVTFSGLLKDAGYDVQVADSLANALNLLEADHFALAVLDIRLDESDEDNTEGLDLAAKIKERWPAIGIVIVTGYGTQDIMKRALEPDARGRRLAVDYVPKTETEKLVGIVQQALAQ